MKDRTIQAVDRSLDSAVQMMCERAMANNYETVWERYQYMLPQCKFGDNGLCCRHCLQGPCRINPSGKEPKSGICGASADVMIARSIARAVAAGTAGHSGHAKHLAHTMHKMAEGKASDYRVKDSAKLRQVAERLGLHTEGLSELELAKEVSKKALADFAENDDGVKWVTTVINRKRKDVLLRNNLIPKGIDHEISEIMHRTLYGVDGDATNLMLGAMRCALADMAGCYMATDLSDILFGTPKPLYTAANMGVLKRDAVNIAVHGHNPVLSDVIVSVAKEMNSDAKKIGAEGINIVGICCTGNELMSRHGIPACTHSVSQEMAILTGAVDAIVVDYQCIMPALADLTQCVGSKLITTMDICKIPGAHHVIFTEEEAFNKAREIINSAYESYKRRQDREVFIPDVKLSVMAGFSVESLVNALKNVDIENPLRPLVENIANGNIQGVCLFAGCNNVKIPQDRNFVTIARKLLKENVLILATGCGAGALMRHGFMDPRNVDELCGESLKKVLYALGEANNLGHPLPGVIHLGSCVDNSRAVALAVAIADYLDVDTDKLPVVASAPEAVSEKAVSIGLYAVTMGFPTHVGVKLPIGGAKDLGNLLTEGLSDICGGYFIYDLSPDSAGDRILSAIRSRRRVLGI